MISQNPQQSSQTLTLDIAWPVLAALITIAFTAGTVRGFAGFGDALIFLPLAGFLVQPITALFLFMAIAAPGSILLVRDAIKTAPLRIYGTISTLMIVFLPIGFWLLTKMDADIFRALTASLALILVFLMVVGWKPKVPINTLSLAILGILCGVIGGASGVPGALIVFYFINAGLRARDVRASTTILLFVFDIVILLMIIFTGKFEWSSLAMIAFLLPAYIIGGWAGKKMFNPNKEKLFKNVALIAIFASGLIGMPYHVFV